MAISVNKVILLGIVGQEPDVKTLPNGGEVAKLNLVTMESSDTANGERQDHAESHLLMAYRTNAKIIRSYVKKGAWLYVEGQIDTRSWEDRQSGQKQHRTEITVTDFVMLSEARQPVPQQNAALGNGNGTKFKGSYVNGSQPVLQGKAPNGRGTYLPNRSGRN